jgi:hypothetical protein
MCPPVLDEILFAIQAALSTLRIEISKAKTLSFIIGVYRRLGSRNFYYFTSLPDRETA